MVLVFQLDLDIFNVNDCSFAELIQTDECVKNIEIKNLVCGENTPKLEMIFIILCTLNKDITKTKCVPHISQ